MKRSDILKPSKRSAALRKHLSNFRGGYDKVVEMLHQSHEYIAELEKSLQQLRQDNKLLVTECRKLRAVGSSPLDSVRLRSGSEDLLRSRSIEETLRRLSTGSNSSRGKRLTFEKNHKISPNHRASDSEDEDEVAEDRFSSTTPIRSRTLLHADYTPVTRPRASNHRETSMDLGENTSGDESAGTSDHIMSGSDIVQRLAQRLSTDAEMRKSSGFSAEVVIPAMEVCVMIL